MMSVVGSFVVVVIINNNFSRRSHFLGQRWSCVRSPRDIAEERGIGKKRHWTKMRPSPRSSSSLLFSEKISSSQLCFVVSKIANIAQSPSWELRLLLWLSCQVKGSLRHRCVYSASNFFCGVVTHAISLSLNSQALQILKRDRCTKSHHLIVNQN